MIIQGSKTNVSIPKEFMSIYNPDTQNYDAIPQFPAQREEYYDSATSTTKIKLIYTLSDSVVANKDDRYGTAYGVVFGMADKYQIVLSNTVQEYISDPLSDLYGHNEYFSSVDVQSEVRSYSTSSMRSMLVATMAPIIIRNPNMTMTADYRSRSALNLGNETYEAIFDFSASASYSQTFVDKVVAGANKKTRTYNFYLDNTSLKDALAAKADQYTTINLYHLDETPWS